jgi:hypothetical protein
MDHLVCPPWSVSYFILWSVFLVNTFFIWRDWLPIHRVHRLKHISLSCDNILNSVKLWYESVMDGCHLWMVVIIWRFLLEIRNYFSGPFSNIFFRFWYTETYINPNDLICFYWLNLMTCSLDICIITTSKLLCQNCLTLYFSWVITIIHIGTCIVKQQWELAMFFFWKGIFLSFKNTGWPNCHLKKFKNINNGRNSLDFCIP